MSKKLFALVMVTSILGGILAGCSGGSTDSTDATKSTDAPKTETAGGTTADATK